MTSDSPGIAAETPTDDRVDRHGAATGWDARLALRFECDGARTVLRGRAHVGPLRVQKALYPEDATVCQVVVVHPPAGIVGGDSLAIDVAVGEGAHAQATTPGAAKWYRSAGRFARQRSTRLASAGGNPPRRRSTDSGAVVACAASIAAGDRPVNGGSPVRHS